MTFTHAKVNTSINKMPQTANKISNTKFIV